MALPSSEVQKSVIAQPEISSFFFFCFNPCCRLREQNTHRTAAQLQDYCVRRVAKENSLTAFCQNHS